MKKLILTLFLLSSIILSSAAQIYFAATRMDGSRYRTEFEKYERIAEFYRQKGFYPTLLDYKLFISQDKRAPELLKNELNKFHVVQLFVQDEGIFHLTPKKIAQAKKIGAVLADYVRSGGALIIHPRNVRYPGNDDEEYWNIIYHQLGFHLEKEGIADKTALVQHEFKTGFSAPFFHTTNIKKHVVTNGVRGLWNPVFSYSPAPATPLVTLKDPSWEVIIRGEKTAASWKINKRTNALDLNKPGTCKTAPPICAVRSMGKGRIALLASDYIWSGQNYGVPSWSHIVETKGLNEKPGDLLQLLVNLIKWGAETAKKNPALGTYKPIPYQPVVFPETVQWDNHRFKNDYQTLSKGIIGAHSNFTDGKSSVEDYVKAAKAAGLKFIVFTDPLELLTPEKLNALKQACKAASNADFYACPGVEFTDGSGIRWIFYGEKVIFPETKPFFKNGFKHVCWDGKVVKNWGRYASQCSFPPSAIIDYGDLVRNQVAPENLWWFYNLIPQAYDHGKLIADNYKQWHFAISDLRIITPITFNRITNADEVKKSMDIAVTAYAPESVRLMLNSRCSVYHLAQQFTPQIAYGKGTPVIVRNFQLINDQKDPRTLQTKGTQRAKGKLSVSSPNGLKEIRIYDAVDGLIRRFDCKGAKDFIREFELVHDKQHYLWLEAEDMKGCKTITTFLRLFDYKQGLYRCGDNLNILGPLGYFWHPDRSEMMPMMKVFRNAEFFSVQGWDRGGPDCPVPAGNLFNRANLEGVGEVLPGNVPKMHGVRMKVQLSSGDLQIVDVTMDSFVEAFDNKFRPGPSMASPARKVEDNPYYIHTQRMYSPRDRMDHHIAWDHRRLYESLEHYDGSFLMYEGEITFKQDITFKKNTNNPFALARFRTEPYAAARLLNDTILVTDQQKGLLQIFEKAGSRKAPHSGIIAEKGFVALNSSPIGYLAIIPVQGEFRYDYYNPGFLSISIGKPGQSFKKGEKLKYAFISGNFIDKKRDGSKIRLAAEFLRDNNYPAAVIIGKQKKTRFFFEVAADQFEAKFKLGAKPGLGIDLPIRITGLKNNGCIAVYSSQRKWFRFVGTSLNDHAVYLQENIDSENDLWVGNIFLADNDSLKLTLVMDGQKAGALPFLEIHNPSGAEIKAKVWSPKNTPVFGGRSFTVTVPAGDSIRYTIR